MALYSAHWLSCVSAVAGKHQHLRYMPETQELPLTKDVEMLSFLIREDISSMLKTGPDDRYRLAQLCLLYLIVFNKREPMDVAEIQSADYQTQFYRQPYPDENEDLLNSLSKFENFLSQQYDKAAL